MMYAIVPTLTILVNDFFEKSFMTESLKRAIVLTIHISGSFDEVENCRPIILFRILTNVLRNLFHNFMTSCLAKFDILNEIQFDLQQRLELLKHS